MKKPPYRKVLLLYVLDDLAGAIAIRDELKTFSCDVNYRLFETTTSKNLQDWFARIDLIVVSVSHAIEHSQDRNAVLAYIRATEGAPPIVCLQLDGGSRPFGTEFIKEEHWFNRLVPASWEKFLDLFRMNQPEQSPEASLQPTRLLPIPEALIDAVLADDCVLYAGSGISVASGLPNWRDLMKQLLTWASESQLIDDDFFSILVDSLEQGDINIAAEGLVQVLKDKGKLDLMAERLGTMLSPTGLELNPLHFILRKIQFSAVMTTNFDSLLEKTFGPRGGPVLTPFEDEGLLEQMSRRKFFLLKLHGLLDRPDTLVMAPALFKEVADNNRALSQFMEGLLSSRTVLFIGTTLDSVQTFLDSFRLRAKGGPHFALLPDGGPGWKIKADLLRRRHGMEVITYPSDHPTPGNVLYQFLEDLEAQAKELRGARRRQEGAATLAGVKLVNIGMFKQIKLAFDSHWNVLLGDNGVGKSTILRAIAAGLAGEDCRPHAEWLLRAGTSQGSITLETSAGDRYTTILERTAGSMRVDAIPTRPLEPEGWAAMGFPPIRQFSGRRTQGLIMEPVRTRPDGVELLPLLEGTVDARPDHLKQWILTLNYQINELRHRNEPSARQEFLLGRVFQVIGELAAGLTLTFKEVDMERGDIIVSTDDGDVPIEAISHGTASLLGWVGVLMHRLSALCPESDPESDPCKQAAIVLVDEIESHMHPAWQQQLVPRLSHLFPAAQFIASSHSPLVIAGMPTNRIIRLGRDEDGRVNRLDIPEDMSMGRADQVLTSRLFGLETTLDHETTQRLEEYRRLLGLGHPTPEERQRLDELKEMVRFRIPSSFEGPAERRAFALMQAMIQFHLGTDYPEARRTLLDHTRELLDELRPSHRGLN